MKKRLWFLLCCFGFGLVDAQYVAIPDSNFGSWLNANGYSACMQGNNTTGWQMDTTCPEVVNATALRVNDTIKNIDGVQFFDALDTLDLSGVWAPTIPVLHCPLRFLNFSASRITFLPDLPVTLTTLYCRQAQLTSLPALPNSLINLDFSSNPLTYFPPLPPNLRFLSCQEYLLNLLPVFPTLPSGLQGFDCSFCQLTTLPALPNGLIYLNCHDNQLSTLPSLPGNLTRLLCYSNHLSTLPALPNSLTYVWCCMNPINTLPTLPASLRTFLCNLNSLTFLPTLPDSLEYLDCDGNNNLNCLPRLPATLRYLNCTGTGVHCLPNIPESLSLSPSSQLQVCDPFISCIDVSSASNLQPENLSITLSPNPASNQLNISIDESLAGAQLNIYNVTGTLVQHVQLSTTNYELLITDLPSGIYMAEVKTRDASAKKRWLKM